MNAIQLYTIHTIHTIHTIGGRVLCRINANAAYYNTKSRTYEIRKEYNFVFVNAWMSKRQPIAIGWWCSIFFFCSFFFFQCIFHSYISLCTNSPSADFKVSCVYALCVLYIMLAGACLCTRIFCFICSHSFVSHLIPFTRYSFFFRWTVLRSNFKCWLNVSAFCKWHEHFWWFLFLFKDRPHLHLCTMYTPNCIDCMCIGNKYMIVIVHQPYRLFDTLFAYRFSDGFAYMRSIRIRK